MGCIIKSHNPTRHSEFISESHQKILKQVQDNNARLGFTLVELSIVLVIIGLLIGGILVAQSLIDSTKISSQVSQLSQLDAQVILFKDRYRYLPGDHPNWGGDGDGLITRRTNIGIDRYQGEIANFWNSLDSKEYPGIYPVPAYGKINISGANKNVPTAKMGSDKSVWTASSMSTNGTTGQFADTSGEHKEVYYIHTSNIAYQSINANSSSWQQTASSTTNGAAKPIELMSLDIKIDDGAPTSGIVMNGSRVGSRGITKISFTECGVGADYSTSYDDYSCTPIVRVGGIVGLPQ